MELRGQPSPDDETIDARDPAGVGFGCLVGRSAAHRGAVEHARMVAASPRTTVLLAGETGTGKELFARGIHYGGPTADAPFVAVNCAAIPDTLLEGELFGHEKGAFTGAHARKQGLFELAGEGTLFLDEIHQLPLALQPKLLRALESRLIRPLGGGRELPVRCRIIAATNVALEDAVARAEFRPDLFYRLNVFRVDIPALRDRGDDVVLLATRFLREIAAEQGGGAKLLAPDALDALRAHSWPGNVRELRNLIERAAILSGSEGVVRSRHLMIQRRTLSGAASAGDGGETIGEIPLLRAGTTLAEIEAAAVRLTLEHTRGNRSAAARMLGISRPTLARILRGGLAAGGDRADEAIA
ncbi:MAG TPA: sigma 54-interacting transcriptional regulator [Gemmatimonadaceae bacterium]|nr:sigma 54-interacting transcriptional regulator [Gemmatimonadaceae bacterium]